MVADPRRPAEIYAKGGGNGMIQAAILILSAAAMWLVSGRSRHARLGWALGLVSQPFWLRETWLHEQYGMFTEPAVFVDDVRQRLAGMSNTAACFEFSLDVMRPSNRGAFRGKCFADRLMPHAPYQRSPALADLDDGCHDSPVSSPYHTTYHFVIICYDTTCSLMMETRQKGQ